MLPKRHDPVLRFFESCKGYRQHEDRALRWLVSFAYSGLYVVPCWRAIVCSVVHGGRWVRTGPVALQWLVSFITASSLIPAVRGMSDCAVAQPACTFWAVPGQEDCKSNTEEEEEVHQKQHVKKKRG
jgi:hypothetical protein